MKAFLNQMYFGNSVLSYLLFLAALVLSVIVLFLLKNILLKRLHAWAQRSDTAMDSLSILKIQKYLLPLLYAVAFYFSFKILKVIPAVSNGVDVAMKLFLAVWCASFASVFLTFLLARYWKKKSADSTKTMAVHWIGRALKTIIWVVAALLLLDNVGVNVSTLAAGLGIGGIAIAFAAQAVLEDMFSFVTILFDRPFEIGDFITVGDQMGTVEHIGVKTTRLRSIGGEELIFSNNDLTNSRVQNYKRMEKRRVLFKIGVTYDTPLEKLKDIPMMMKEIIGSVDSTSFDRAHFSAYAGSSLDFEIVYYVMSSDYNKYMDIQQEINFRIKEEFDKRNIEFAFPTRTLYLQRPDVGAEAGNQQRMN